MKSSKTGAHSTDPQSPETAEHLCEKCDEYAKNWQPLLTASGRAATTARLAAQAAERRTNHAHAVYL
ncbi:MAG: hypothetical protein ACLUZQ_08730 [Butyricicoccus sp.]